MLWFLVALTGLQLFLVAVSRLARYAYPRSRLQLFEREEEYLLHWATHRWVRAMALSQVYVKRYIPHIRTLIKHAEGRAVAIGLYKLACAFVQAMARAPAGVERRAFREYARHPNFPRKLRDRFPNHANH
ncbi:MAG: hypothetical protein HY462_01730 [Parcubacteria group bacterium]|nr:hypothetical protein [Parcubacteria group bacterium]